MRKDITPTNTSTFVPTGQARQVCRKGIHMCTPAITLTFDGGTRRLHWCAEHVADAERYRGQSDQAELETAVI